jgi:uncharacterized damage-inducible protein DinB
MEMINTEPATAEMNVIITPEAFLTHWQGHRSLTRKVIEAFPETEFYNFSIGGMRTYAELTMEMLDMTGPGIEGIATGQWKAYGEIGDGIHSITPATKEDVLKLWDFVTEKIDTFWPQIAQGRFQQNDVAFGQWPAPVHGTLFYFVDNEIHHRAQGYVYLRALGIEPPAFWDRG